MSRVEQALRRSGSASVAATELPGAADEVIAPLSVTAYPLEPEQIAERTPAPAAAPARGPALSEPAIVDPRSARISRALNPAAGGKLVVSSDASPAIVEQYGRLAATLYQAQAEHSIKTVMVASALPREGKTLTAANLALTLSESYRQRVLLIDTDLRGAAMHTLLGVPLAPGLGDFLDGEDMNVPIAQLSETLSVLPAGISPGSPVAGLVSTRMKRLLEHAAERFDWVLLDTPPLALLSDAHLLARLTDGVVFVIAAGSSPYAMVQRAIATVGADRVLGVVLNRASGAVVPTNTYYQRYTTVASRPSQG